MPDGPEARAVIRFSERAEVEPLWQDVRAGIIRHVSAGYRVRTYRIEEDADPPVWRAIDWQPVELSLVAVPADPGAGMRSDTIPPIPAGCIRRPHPPRTETSTMNDTITRDAPGRGRRRPGDRTRDHRDRRHRDRGPRPRRHQTSTDADGASPPDDAWCAPTSAMRSALEAQQRRAAPAETVTRQAVPDATATRAIAERVLKDERERVAGITDAARKLGVDTTVADDLVRRGIGLDEARRTLIDKAAEQDRSDRDPAASRPRRQPGRGRDPTRRGRERAPAPL